MLVVSLSVTILILVVALYSSQFSFGSQLYSLKLYLTQVTTTQSSMSKFFNSTQFSHCIRHKTFFNLLLDHFFFFLFWFPWIFIEQPYKREKFILFCFYFFINHKNLIKTRVVIVKKSIIMLFINRWQWMNCHALRLDDDIWHVSGAGTSGAQRGSD